VCVCVCVCVCVWVGGGGGACVQSKTAHSIPYPRIAFEPFSSGNGAAAAVIYKHLYLDQTY
jgi:hypothetical protein